ncbi:MarR family transcriptional regulator [Draconibacterium sp. IB214405]|uniref:MarR family winged helix-turn-helix transcriptional regulator n=1 Tax=Draconibacterium sp. IB214405 TaxID=3097352 RepID=UPI002A145D31|nr:MarR family transcriptional regulator [Draconibacterium sp. IB214405]MDX8340892.1 MarR family transcriptional regulator [Draconibacterium sp. IB214405]
MNYDSNNLTLIDLISEQHAHLRRTVEQRWKEQSDIRFSHAEWHLLSKIDQQDLTISQAALIVGISRQAMQKTVKKLESQGYISSAFRDGNKRDKFLSLTKNGQECCDKNNRLKAEMEKELEKQLGKTEVKKLKTLFRDKWLKE